ncbi:unnamed protein product [Prorocentrum cordatum]|uniref:Phospholipase B-like n=1 Tax=Prorocentrum cordatum TaxID=2364126 RepID=A0ABN9RW44_9DINO|nr:unnamed protein product [Polarella glacialis]
MKLSTAFVAMANAVMASDLPDVLPELNSFMDIAWPKWEVDDDCNRLETKPCSADSCEWNPCYVTAMYDGLHPDYGGHPTENDVKYYFYAAAPFDGQPYGGTAQHCELDAPDDVKKVDCPKIETLTDDGPNGPGHIPPHIALYSFKWAVEAKLYALGDMFEYDDWECKVNPNILLKMIRHYFPRTEGEKVAYPAPYTEAGGSYPYEFPAGRGLGNQTPPYEPGSAHWCTDDFLATGLPTAFCPYIFEGPDKGQYRHPHIAFAALQNYLANLAMPDKCSEIWLENNPDFLSSDRITTKKAFPKMSNDDADNKTFLNWIGQPDLPWSYDPGSAKNAEVMLATVTRGYLTFDGSVGLVASGAVAAAPLGAALIGCVIFLAD